MQSLQVDALLREHRAKHGITARAISDEEIVSRCFLPLINEGFKVCITPRESKFDERVALACLKWYFTEQFSGIVYSCCSIMVSYTVVRRNASHLVNLKCSTA
jgi:hypothetical protein